MHLGPFLITNIADNNYVSIVLQYYVCSVAVYQLCGI